MLFPTSTVARRCLDFIMQKAPADAIPHISMLELSLDKSKQVSASLIELNPAVSVVLLPEENYPIAKEYWQHTGDGVSSRRAEFCHALFKEGLLVPLSGTQTPPKTPTRPVRAPRRYQNAGSIDISNAPAATPKTAHTEQKNEPQESTRFLEERFGRNLDMSLVNRAKSAIRRRIAGTMASDADTNRTTAESPLNTRRVAPLGESDVYLFPAGMNAIYTAHRALLAGRGPMRSINFGFPYVDTLKILQKFGPGCIFYGNGSSEELDDLERRLQEGEKFLGFFCEFPGNPLLTCPDLKRIRSIADKYDFALVVDETIGTFANINVLNISDIVVSSLTKIFSGDSNVMGGSVVLNPESKYYQILKTAMEDIYEDTYWPEDAIFMERNSRDFITRVERINANAEAICGVLLGHPSVKNVFYPKHNPTKPNYDACRLPHGGYGGLVSVVFNNGKQAQAFYDGLDTEKGPSLGTNFTLCSPYVILAHYGELEWAEQFGVSRHLVRFSVGLEETQALRETFARALRAAEASSP